MRRKVWWSKLKNKRRKIKVKSDCSSVGHIALKIDWYTYCTVSGIYVMILKFDRDEFGSFFLWTTRESL